MKKPFKRILSIVLTIIMVLSAVPSMAYATDNIEEDTISGVSSNVNLKATNSVGELVTQALQTNGMNSDCEYGITGIAFEGKTATVSGFAKKNCILLVALFDEKTDRMIASGMGEFVEDGQTADVEISTSAMPKYFIARAFLLDEYGASLCDKYTTKEHTHDFEEFFAKTVNDFEEEKVINLDESVDNNFVVLTEDASLVNTKNGNNKLISVDDEKGIYIFENINSDIASLKKGDIINYEQESEQDVLIIKIKSISISGKTATIVEDSTELTEVFDFVKINGNNNGENVTVDMSKADSGVEYRQIEKNEDNSDQIQLNSLDYNDSKKYSQEFSIKEKEIKKNVKLSFTLNFEINASVSLYYDCNLFSKDYVDMSVKIEPSIGVSFTLTGKIEKSFVKLGEIGIYVCPGVYIGFTPEFVVEVSGEITISGRIEGCLGYSYNSDEGFRNISSPFSFKPEINISVTIFVGINMKPHISIIHEKVADASISGEIGFDIKASTDLLEGVTSEEKHDCAVCIDGDISFVIKFSAEVKLINSDKWTYSADLWNTSFKIADFYISIPYGFGWGICPHKYYEVKFTVADSDSEKLYKYLAPGVGILSGLITGNFAVGLNLYGAVKDNFFEKNSSALIDNGSVCGNGNARYYPDKNGAWGGNTATVKEGVATLYFTSGEQTAEVSAPGYKNKDVSFTIYESGKSLVVFLEKEGSTSGGDLPDIGFDDTGYSISGDTLTISGKGDMKNYSGFGATEWDSQKDSIKKVIINSGVTGLGDYAFAQFRNLETVSIPDTVTKIGTATFYECNSLQKVTLPSSVKTLGDYAFFNCYSITNISLGEVEQIGNYTFAQCNGLTSASLPKTVVSIGDSAFAYCNNLKSLTINSKTCNIYSSPNTIPSGTTIYGGSNSTAQKYAIQYGRSYVSITVQDAGEIITELSDSLKITFAGAVPGNDYILLNVTGYGEDFVLSTSNLEYIDQLTAGSDGKITSTFIPKDYYDTSSTLLIGDFGNGIQTKVVAPSSNSTSISIKNNPGIKTINYREGIALTASIDNPVDGLEIQWYVNGTPYSAGENFVYSNLKSDITVEAKIVNSELQPILKDGNEITDIETIKVKAGFWQKLVAFFKFTIFNIKVINEN